MAYRPTRLPGGSRVESADLELVLLCAVYRVLAAALMVRRRSELRALPVVLVPKGHAAGSAT